MEEQNNDKQFKILEMAKKKREIHLLEKLYKGKSSTPTLSKSEIKELEQFGYDPKSPHIVDNQDKVARAFGVSARTVRHWIKDSMPVTPQGKYDLREIQSWRFLKNEQSKKKQGKSDQRTFWEEQDAEWKAKTRELKYKKEIGELIPRAKVEKGLIQVSLALKQALLKLGKEVAPQLAERKAREVEVILTLRIKDLIKLLAQGKIFKQDFIHKKKAKA